MSRATRIRVFIVSGFRPLTSSAHASDELRSALVEVIAIAAAKPLADRCRNLRRDSACLAGVVSVAVVSVSSCFFCARFVVLGGYLKRPNFCSTSIL
jgi:hypothetical protein